MFGGMSPEEFNSLSTEERRNAIVDQLAELGEIWSGESPDDIMARGMIGAVRSLFDSALTLEAHSAPQANSPVVAIYIHTYQMVMKSLPAFISISEVKREEG